MGTMLPYAPFAFGVAGAAVAMIFDAWRDTRAAIVAAVALLTAGAIAAGWSALATGVVGGAVRAGGTVSVAPAVCLLLGAAALVGGARGLASGRAGSRLTALASLAAAASALAAASADIAVLFLAIEMLALCGYGLVTLADTDRAREAAMKWFVQGSIASVIFVIGMALLLGRTGGSLRYDSIATVAATSLDAPLAVGFVLVLLALAFKLGAFPLHSWMPDAYETAPATAAAILASAGKVGPLAAAVWLSYAVTGAAGERVIQVVSVIAVCSIVFGNLAALRQRSLARMLAYSGIAQVGYALVGLPLGARSSSVLVFAVLYGLTAAASFIAVEALHRTDPTWDGTIRGLAGLAHGHPALAASLAVIMFSLTGIPLTAGFWGKLLVFAGASIGGYLWLAIAGMVGSVVSFGYYGAVIRAAYVDEPPAGSEEVRSRSAGGQGALARATTGTLAGLIVIAGVVPLASGLAPVLGALLR